MNCDFCSDPLPDGSIPGCRQEAVTQVRRVTERGFVETANVCVVHRDLIGAETPLHVENRPDVPDDPDEVMKFFETSPAVRLLCKGCGDQVVVRFEDEMMGGSEAVLLDVLVMTEHLRICPWRRREK